MHDGSPGIGGHRIGRFGNGGFGELQPPGQTWHDVMFISCVYINIIDLQMIEDLLILFLFMSSHEKGTL